jgi:hypothetical protein
MTEEIVTGTNEILAKYNIPYVPIEKNISNS